MVREYTHTQRVLAERRDSNLQCLYYQIIILHRSIKDCIYQDSSLVRFTEDDAAPTPLHVAGQDEAATADDGPQMKDAGPNDNTAQQLECHLCSCRGAETDRLLEENRRLAEKNIERGFF